MLDRLLLRQSDFDKVSNAIQERLNTLESGITEQATRLEAQKNRFDALITDQQAKFGDEQVKRNEEFSARQKDKEKEFTAFIAESNKSLKLATDQATLHLKALDDARASLLTSHETWRESAEQSLLATLEEAKTAHSLQQEAHTNSAKELLQHIQGHLNRAKKIVGLIGNTGMTGHFQKVANRELWTAEIFRFLAVAFFIALVLGVWWVVKDIGADEFSWEIALFRVGVALALLAPAIYCAKESSRHRRVENRNRRIELELASIGPYLETIPEDKAQHVIEQLAKQYFGNQSPDETLPPEDFPVRLRSKDVVQILDLLAKFGKH